MAPGGATREGEFGVDPLRRGTYLFETDLVAPSPPRESMMIRKRGTGVAACAALLLTVLLLCLPATSGAIPMRSWKAIPTVGDPDIPGSGAFGFVGDPDYPGGSARRVQSASLRAWRGDPDFPTLGDPDS